MDVAAKMLSKYFGNTETIYLLCDSKTNKKVSELERDKLTLSVLPQIELQLWERENKQGFRAKGLGCRILGELFPFSILGCLVN